MAGHDKDRHIAGGRLLADPVTAQTAADACERIARRWPRRLSRGWGHQTANQKQSQKSETGSDHRATLAQIGELSS
jgi:hypothetical protein